MTVAFSSSPVAFPPVRLIGWLGVGAPSKKVGMVFVMPSALHRSKHLVVVVPVWLSFDRARGTRHIRRRRLPSGRHGRRWHSQGPRARISNR